MMGSFDSFEGMGDSTMINLLFSDSQRSNVPKLLAVYHDKGVRVLSWSAPILVHN